MHETHLVKALIASVEQQAAAQGSRKITRIKLRFNPLLSHSADHVRFCFDVVKKEGALVREAALELVQEPGRVRCRDCKNEFEVDELPNLCPRCQSIQLVPLSSTGMVLESFELEK